jgi:DNA repair photolyase
MTLFDKNRSGSGTREWSEISLNVALGCQNFCKYCFARSWALRYHLISSREEWKTERINPKMLTKKFGKRKGVFMYPTMHDITPHLLGSSIVVLSHVLEAGNKVLVVSKPRLECVREMCKALAPYRGQMLFRFTIGSMIEDICRF